MPITVPSKPIKGAAEAMVAAWVLLHQVQATGQHRAQQGALLQLLDHLDRWQAFGRDRDGLVEQFGRGDFFGFQVHEPINDQRQSQNRAGQQRPNRPARSLK
jgi:hypothetical protein